MISDKTFKVIDGYGNFEKEFDGGLFFFFEPNDLAGLYQAWECRELFGKRFKDTTQYVGFYDNNLDLDKIDEFFTYIENKVKIKNHTIFYETNLDNVIIVEPSNFWKMNDTKRGFFSLFLRCAAVHYNGGADDKNIMDAIKHYPLANMIKSTVEHFLAGHTKPTYKELYNHGLINHYYNQHNGITQDLLNKYLIKPQRLKNKK